MPANPHKTPQHKVSSHHKTTTHRKTAAHEKSSPPPVGFYDTLNSLMDTSGGLLNVEGDIRLIIARGAVTALGLLALIGGGYMLLKGVGVNPTDVVKAAAV
jgi:hypothetical protein